MKAFLLSIVLTISVFFGCKSPQPSHQTVNTLIDNWHKAATNADEEVFFGSMTEDAIYLGTDASERWLRDELKAWSAKYFDRESAWDFTPRDRNIYFSNDGKLVWFEELLDTWMGTCRGSGVLYLTKNGWKIAHYHLSVTIDNDLIQNFISLVKKEPNEMELNN